MSVLFVCFSEYGQEKEKNVKSCRDCAMAAKGSPMKFTPWPKTEKHWARLHIDFADPKNGYYYLIVADSFTKWPEVM